MTTGDVTHRIWDMWLDGDSVRYIVGQTDMSPTKVKAILATDPPEAILSDMRHVHGCRAMFIGMSTLPESGPHAGQAFLPVFYPRKCNGDVFRKGVRAAAREFRSLTGGSVNPLVIEGVEMEAMMKFANEKGFLAFRFDEEGNLIDDIPGADREADNSPTPGR